MKRDNATLLKPIETVYNGYRFRSRLEARWAVFFDKLGVKYRYEPEGFDLGEVGYYLPDFWLETVGMWAEVKPTIFTPSESARCEVLAKTSGYDCLMLDGDPEYRPFTAWTLFTDGDGDNHRFSDGYVVIEVEFLLGDQYLHDEHRFFSCPWGGEEPSNFVADAYRAARQARFEHGENPKR